MVDEKVKNTVAKVNIPKDDYKLKPGETLEESFEIAVSTGAMVTGHPYSHQLKVSADVPGLDPSAKVDIFII